jgi:hypothetical protein
MTFALSSPDSAIGAVLNWVPGNAPVTIAAWGSSMNLLDQQRRKTKAPTNRHCVSRREGSLAGGRGNVQPL